MKIKIHIPLIPGASCTASCSNALVKQEINLTSLLKEMVYRERIAWSPETGYRTLQASSYNRESVISDESGWFADSDGLGFIRTEMNNGQKEWGIMEDQGPGVITKIWAVCFHYGFSNTTGKRALGLDFFLIKSNFLKRWDI